MNKEKLSRVLKYAKSNISHPEAPKFQPLCCDSVVYNCPTSQFLRGNLERRIKIIEEYERFEKEIDELLMEVKTNE